MRRYLTAAGSSVLGAAVLLVCYLEGALPSEVFLQIMAALGLSLVAFFALFRTGLNLRFPDPSLTLPQMLVATLLALYAMYWSDAGRPVFVVLLLMGYLFGILRLGTRALLAYAAFILAGYGGVIGLLWAFRPASLDFGVEALQWIALGLTLPWFALMGGYVTSLRQRLRKSNARLESALARVKANQASLAEAQRMAGFGSWSFDVATRRARWSRETYAIFGVDPKQPAPVGQAFLDFIHPDDRNEYLRLLRGALDEGRSYEAEYRIVVPAAGVRWVHAVAHVVADEGGRVKGLRGTVADITEHRSQAEALTGARDQAAAARAALVDAIESLTDGFALFDADDRLVLCNRPYAQLFAGAKSFEAIAGKRFEELVRLSVANGESIEPQFDGDVEAWVAERVRRHRNPGPEAPDLQLAGGRWFQVSERRTRSGGIVGVRHEITKRKQLEQRQAMEHAVTRLLAESATVAEAMPRIIQTICETLGWDCGARWAWDAQSRVLSCAEIWSIPAKEVREFVVLSSQHRFAPTAAGLIRRAWSSGEPVWIPDLAREQGFLRAPIAAKGGLRAAFAFPLQVGAEPHGVMEFFTRTSREPDPSLLQVTRSIGLQIGQFISRKAAEEKIRQLAHFDFLSGLPNRTLFNELLAHALSKVQRRGTSLALLFIDLDGFKRINDSFGHDAGDHLLATFAQRLRESLRKSDVPARLSSAGTPARFGGDEFVVMVDDSADLPDLATVAQRILTAAAEPLDLAGVQCSVTASIGIAVCPADGMDIDTLLKNADTAMYAAKQAGGNRYRFYSEGSGRARVAGPAVAG